MIRITRIALGMVLSATAATTTVATAGPADATNSCQIGVEQPIYNGSINATAGWTNCYRGSHFTVVLRQDRPFWPDTTLRSARGQGVQGSRTLVYACGNRFDPIKVFVEIRHGGKKVQSARAILPCA